MGPKHLVERIRVRIDFEEAINNPISQDLVQYCLVTINDKVYRAKRNIGELALWDACKYLQIDPLPVFKNWLETNTEWFAGNIDQIIEYVRNRWISHMNVFCRKDGKDYIEFLQKHHHCIANHLLKVKYTGMLAYLRNQNEK